MSNFVDLKPHTLIGAATNDQKNKIKQEFLASHRNDTIIIEKQNLVLKEWIGMGNYGFVYKAFLKLDGNRSEKLAVKKLDNCEFLEFRET